MKEGWGLAWRVSHPSSVIEDKYYDPSRVTLVFHECRLMSNPEKAQKVFETGTRESCAWIECDNVSGHLKPKDYKPEGDELLYNPTVQPYWMDKDGTNINNKVFTRITSHGFKVYAL